jgi:hypothetical protein
MANFYPFRRATRNERYKSKFLAGFIWAGFLLGGLIAWLSQGTYPAMWIVIGLVSGAVLAFVVALVRGETF